MRKIKLFFCVVLFFMFSCSNNSSKNADNTSKKADNEQEEQTENYTDEENYEEAESNTEEFNSLDTIDLEKYQVGDNEYCYIDKVSDENGKYYLTVDYVQYLFGDEAEKAVQSFPDPPNGEDKVDYYINDDYILLNENPKLRTLVISENALVSVFNGEADEYGIPAKVYSLGAKGVTFGETFGGLYQIYVEDGVINFISEEYLP